MTSALLVTAATALAAPGDLDPSFAGDGTRTIGFGAAEMAFGVAFDETGNIILAGGPASGQSSSDDFKVAGLTASGVPNPGFGGADDLPDGIVTVGFGNNTTDQARAVAVQDDGKAVVAGVTTLGGSTRNFGLTRLHTNGTIDSTFAGGVVSTEFGTGNTQTSDDARALAIDGAGRVIAAGSSGSNFAVARYRPNGSLDTSFSGDGRLTVDFGGTDSARAVAIAPDGDVIVVGDGTAGGDLDLAIVRINAADGTLDTAFGDGGKRLIPVSDSLDDRGHGVAVAPDGKITIAGVMAPGNSSRLALVRLVPGGTLDPAFAGGTPLVIDAGAGASSGALAVAITPDLKIVSVGEVAGTSSFSFLVARTLPDGTPDPSFGPGGIRTYDSEFGGTSAGGAAVKLTPDGSIIAAGQAITSTDGQDFAVAKIEGDPLNLDTIISSGPPSDQTLTQKDVQFSFSSPSPGVVGFECALGNEPFMPCSSPVSRNNVADGRHTFQARAVNTLGARDPSPAARTFTIDTTAPWLRIKRKKLKVDRKGRTTAKLKCSFERSGPCEGVIAVKTVGKFKLSRPAAGTAKRGKRGKQKRRTIRLARSRYSLGPGTKQELRLRISGKRKRKLIRRNRHARKVSVIGKVRDQLGNRDKVIKEMKVVLVKGKKARGKRRKAALR